MALGVFYTLLVLAGLGLFWTALANVMNLEDETSTIGWAQLILFFVIGVLIMLIHGAV